ncbi:MAG: FAD-dependent oxidoreductase [Kiritimatiellae bacterium]|nr:FAD-dependent oxidoreductase [Kiritimatiellia bacterium]
MAQFFAKKETFIGGGARPGPDSVSFSGGEFSVAPQPTGANYHWVWRDVGETWSAYVKGAPGVVLTLWPELSPLAPDIVAAAKRNKDWKYDGKNAVKDRAVTNSFELTGGWQRVWCFAVTDNRTVSRRSIALKMKATGPVEMKKFQLQVTGEYPYRDRYDPGVWVDGGRSSVGSPLRCADPQRMAGFPYREGAFAFWIKNAPGVPESHPVNAWSFAKAWATQWGFGCNTLYTGDPRHACQMKKKVPRCGEWVHVAGVWRRDRLALYLNGELAGERIASDDPKRKVEVKLIPQQDNAGMFRVGACGEGSGSVDAVMDEFAVFNRALDDAEVRELAEAGRGMLEGTRRMLADNLFFNTFFRNETNAALRLSVWSPAAGEYKLVSTVGGEVQPVRKVALPAGFGRLEVPFDPARFLPGRHRYSFSLSAADGDKVLSRSGELVVRGRLERDAFLYLSWGGWGYIHHDFGDIVGINCYNVGVDGAVEIRRIINHGAYPNIRYENGQEWFRRDFDWAGIRAKAKKDLAFAAGQHAWVSTLLNSEIYGSGVAQRAKNNPKYLAVARSELGVEPEFTYGTAPSEVDWRKLGKAPSRGVIGHDYSATLETLNWVMLKGMPLYRSNRETAAAIREIQPGNLVWSEPLSGGLADTVCMGADWLYQYSTATTLLELLSQYSCCRAYGRPYMPTLGGSYWPTQRGRHPTLKDAAGRPKAVEMAQGADEVAVKTWLSIGAVPAHHLSFFALDAWEYGMSNAVKFAGSPTNDIKHIAEPDAAARYGAAWHRDIAPAAELLRDMPNVRPDVAFLMPIEIEHGAGFWWGHHHYSMSLRGALAGCAPAFDVLGGAEMSTGDLAAKLSGYKYAVLPMARVVYAERAAALAKAAAGGTVIVQDSYATNHYPNEVWLKNLSYTPGNWGSMKKEFLSWYTNVVPELTARMPATSTCDGGRGFTFTKEYKGVRYVVVVNDARDPKPSYLNIFKTNDWYRVVGAPQKITTTIRGVPPGAAVYLFNARGRPNSLTAEYAPAEGRVYCVYPKALKAPSLALEGAVRPGAKATLRVKIADAGGAPAPGRQIVALELADGAGGLRDESGRYAVEDGETAITLRFAANEPPALGERRWRAKVTDLTTGLSSELTFEMQTSPTLVEAESFAEKGGWVVDQQFMDQMGSPFLLAHGLGRPVKDAVSSVLLAPGRYRLWVRTRDWVAPHGPGLFAVLVNGRPAGEFGKHPDGKWAWRKGEVFETKGPSRITLRDMTGFEGRVDALMLVPEDSAYVPPETEDFGWRRALLGLPQRAPDAGSFDFVVVGGGYAGMCAAVEAARMGLKTAIVQDRPVFGGNGSNEVRVGPVGGLDLPPFPKISSLMHEINRISRGRGHTSGGLRPPVNDGKVDRWMRSITNLSCYTSTRAVAVEKNADGTIAAVVGRNIETAAELRFPGRFFCDATGDAWLGVASGAEVRTKPELKEATGETLAAAKGETPGGYGSSNFWITEWSDRPSTFPSCPWAHNVTAESLDVTKPRWPVITRNPFVAGWNWESGFDKDAVEDGEWIRDNNFRAAYGTWDYLKNKATNRSVYAVAEMTWLGFVTGKRAARRIVGDYVLCEQDLTEHRVYPDGVVPTTWYLDLHFPHPYNERHFPGESYRSCAYDDPRWREFKVKNSGRMVRIKPYPIPFRCLYSKTVSNLFMAGKDISTTHVAMSSIRVENTTGQTGVVVGRAAGLCVRNGWTPRQLATGHFAALAKELSR